MTTDINWINQYIAKTFAIRVSELNGSASLDDVLPVCAAIAVPIDYKDVDDQQLTTLMKAIKQFVRHNKRFMNFSKAAIIEGLEKEWCSKLDFDEKATMLSEYKIFAGIDDREVVLVNQKTYDAYLKANISDPNKYGTMPYESKVKGRRSVSKPKNLLTSVEPDPKLADKLQPYIEWYKRYFKIINNVESYKWEATQHFQEYFDIDAPNLEDNLAESLRRETNLLSGSFNFSKDTLLKNARFSPEDVRFALRQLFDETVNLSDRVNSFIERFKEIHSANQQAGHLRQNEQASQNEHSISVYLAFRYPTKHYIYKYTVWGNAKAEMELDYPSLSHFASKLLGFELICDQIRNVLLADSELISMHDEVFKDDLSNYNLLSQDFLYAISNHFVSLDKPPVLERK